MGYWRWRVKGDNGNCQSRKRGEAPIALKIVAELKPEPGKTFAHVEFTKDGKYVLASLWDMDGAIIVYDAATLMEVRRLPMKKPVGKYNVWNRITKSEGASH